MKATKIRIVAAIRSFKSLKDRFKKTIHPDVQTFNGHWRIAHDNKPSGTNDEDLMQMAMDNYKEIEEKEFKFANCHEILQEMPKYNPMHEPEPGDDEDSDEEQEPVNKIGAPMGSSLVRPMGSKRAKKMRKDQASIETIESKKQQSLDAIAASAWELSAAVREKNLIWKETADWNRTMDEAKFLWEMGDNEGAMKLIADYKEAKAQREAAAAAAAAAKPPSVSTRAESPHVPETVDVLGISDPTMPPLNGNVDNTI